MIRIVGPIALGVLLIAVSACGESPPYAPESTVWAEFMTPDEVIGQADWIAQKRLAVNLACERGTALDIELPRILSAFADRHIPVRLWPLVPEEEGYWVNENNIAAFDPHIHDLLKRLEGTRHSVVAVTFDLEPDIRRVQRLKELSASGDSQQILSFFADARDPAKQAEATRALQALVADVRAAGLEVHASTLPMILDSGDRQRVVEDVLDTPVSGIQWDRLSFQVYRSLFQANFASFSGGEAYTPDLIFSYAQSARKRFGAHAALDLGIVQRPEIMDGHPQAALLQADTAAAVAAGFTPAELQFYALDGLAVRDDRDAWIAIPESAEAPPPSPATQSVRDTFALLASF